MSKKQYTTKQMMKLAAKIMQRAVEISETTKHDVFCYYCPHVKWIEVHIHRGGWTPEGKWIEHRIHFQGYSDTEAEIAEVIAALDRLEQEKE